MVASQHNARLHAVATVVVTGAGALVGLSWPEWCWIVLAIVSVWTAEALNTAFEFLTDVASPTFHPIAGKAKDVAAGAVLLAAGGAVVIGALVFFRRWLICFNETAAEQPLQPVVPLKTKCRGLLLVGRTRRRA
jgi:diacylglycerol kinase (ATP)